MQELVMSNREQVPAKVGVLVRKPVRQVFSAITDPISITRFWLSKSSGPLKLGQTVRWDFMVPGSVVDTTVTALEADKLVEIAWSDGTTVRFTFELHSLGTHVEVENWGFAGSQREIVNAALEATQGFTIVLCDLKTFLESGQQMHLSRDKAILIEEKQNARRWQDDVVTAA
jgi:uncharacterized protein YndB with AHSA1/START domain